MIGKNKYLYHYDLLPKWVIFILLAMLAAFQSVSCFLTFENEAKEKYSRQINMMDQRMLPLFLEINNFPSGSGNDALFLSKLSGLEDINEDENLQKEQDNLLNFADQNKVFSQIIYVDVLGKERIKVENGDSDAKLASIGDLENIAGQDYFLKASETVEGKVIISDLFLGDTGNGQEPLLRYIAPVYDNGEFDGAVIMLVRANYFLDDIRNFSRDGEDAFLINSKGQYITCKDRFKEFDSTGEYNFFSDYPDAASLILKNSDSRYFETSTHVFSFRKIIPVLGNFEYYNGSLDSKNSTADNYWILVVIGEKSEISGQISFLLMERIAVLAIQIFIILAIAIILWRSNNKMLNRHKQ